MKRFAYFPDFYPDELFYSGCSRYVRIMGHTVRAIMFQDLFNSAAHSYSKLFAPPLELFVGRLPAGLGLTAEQIIYDHTLFPFFIPLLSPEQVSQAWDTMLRGAGEVSMTRMGIRRWRNRRFNRLRYCPQCAIEERQRLGECYWHRTHQLPGYEVCPAHHTWLEVSNVPVEIGDYAEQPFVTAQESVPAVLTPRPLDPEHFSHQVLLALVAGFDWLAQQRGLRLEREEMSRRLVTSLIYRGLASYQGKPKWAAIVEMFREQYPADLLDLLNCGPVVSCGSSWVHRLIQKKATSSLLHYLLFIHFLGFTLPEFLEQPTGFLPFGPGPWPCLNPVCPHYQKRQVKQLRVEYNRFRVSGIFTCECGFVYSRSGPDQHPLDQYRRHRRVLDYGSVWRDRLRAMWLDPQINRKTMANTLGISQATLTNQARKLGLGTTPAGERFEVAEWQSAPAVDPAEKEAELAARRQEWLALIDREPDLLRGQLMSKYPGPYAWLYRNDLIWLLAHLPPPASSRSYNFAGWRAYWADRDKELAPRVRMAAQQIRAMNNPCRCVSLNAIRHRLKTTQLDEEKLPQTTQVLAEVLETDADFAIRKAWLAARTWCEAGERPISWSKFTHGSEWIKSLPEIRAIWELLRRGDCAAIAAHFAADEPVLPVAEPPASGAGEGDLEKGPARPRQKILPPDLTSPVAGLDVPPPLPPIRHLSPAYKLRILAEIDAFTEPGGRRAILLREGLHSSHISQWRKARLAGRLGSPPPDEG